MSDTNLLPIFDGHNDVLLELYNRARGADVTFFSHSEQGHLDLPRARAGGFAGGFFAVFLPPDPSQPGPPTGAACRCRRRSS
jgi:membrane dipeptidase